jgi:pyruvate,water dikinase
MFNQASAVRYVLPFEQLRMTDVETVGGKNASLGEMISQLAAAGVRVPGGFATTAQAFRDFLEHNRLTTRIAQRLEKLNPDDVKALLDCGPRSEVGSSTPKCHLLSRMRFGRPSPKFMGTRRA